MKRVILGCLLLLAVAAFGQDNPAARGGRRGAPAGAANANRRRRAADVS